VAFSYRNFKLMKFYPEGDYDYWSSQAYTIIDDIVLIGATQSVFRLKGEELWVWYTPKTLAQALKDDAVVDYYCKMAADPRSAKWVESFKKHRGKMGFYLNEVCDAIV